MMDGYPNKKSKSWRGNMYSETRYAVIKWLERELPNVTGEVLNVAAGGWPVPKQLLDPKKVTKYTTYDQKFYGDGKNPVDIYGDVHSLPKKWTNKWDCVICNQAIECFKNPFKAMEEMHRVLKIGGVILIDFIFAYRWFGYGSFPGHKPKKHRVYDYWRFTRDGVELLMEDFKNVKIERTGPEKWNAYCYMAKGIK
jgi:SAM-dependent methyltransferase